jgi:hypothetical protein
MFRFSVFFLLISLVFFASLSLAGIPKLINYQGMLTDNSGTPLTGSYNLTFKIWTDTTGGSYLWTETQNGVQVTNGLFNVILGKVTTLSLPFDQQYWLEVAVGAETMPRLRLTSVGYSYRAAIADSATVAVSSPTGGGWTKNGNRVSLTTSSDSVGIGTTAPQAKLHVSGGDIRLDYGGDISMIYADGHSSIIWPVANDLQVCNFDTGYIDFRTGTSLNSATSRLYIANDGKIGIGTIYPERIVHIVGVNPRILIEASSINPEINFKNSDDVGTETWALYKHGTTDDFRFYQSGDKVTIQNSTGNVGIGTTGPGYKLDVAGQAHATGFPTSSDARLKKNVTPLTDVLRKLERIRGVSFDWNEKYESMGRSSGHREIGVIAQEVEDEFPELVTTWGEEKYRAVDYGRMTAVLIEAIKELKAENEGLKKRIEVLEAK